MISNFFRRISMLFQKNLKQRISILLFSVCLFLLFHALKDIKYRDVMREIDQLPDKRIFLALFFTAINYFLYSLYDTLAFHHFSFPFRYPKIAFTACISYSVANVTGLSIISGSALRKHLYAFFGLTNSDIIKIGIFNMSTMGFAIVFLSSSSLLLCPVQLSGLTGIHQEFFTAAGSVLLILLSSVVLTLRKGRKVFISGTDLELPSRKTAILQILLGSSDLILSGIILYTLLPADVKVPVLLFMQIFLLSLCSGIISTIPGGLGVFELLMIKGLSSYLKPTELISSMLAFRGIYYLIPLFTGITVLIADEALTAYKKSRPSAFRETVTEIFPSAISFLSFSAGALLVMSCSLPPVQERMNLLYRYFPLSSIEISHFISCISGTILLLVSYSLSRCVKQAWIITVLISLPAVIFSLIKGFEYEIALIFLLNIFLLLTHQNLFRRDTSIFNEHYSASWITAISFVLLFSVWLGFFSFKHVDYSTDLWWNFTLMNGASRFMRSLSGSVLILSVYLAARFYAKKTLLPVRKSPQTVQKLLAVLQCTSETCSWTSLTGDKHFLFSPSGKSFIQFISSDRFLTAPGDPAGIREEFSDLIWQFKDLCTSEKKHPVFFNISDRYLENYLSCGFSLQKIGEAGFIELSRWKNPVLSSDLCFELLSHEQLSEIKHTIPAADLSSDGIFTRSTLSDSGNNLLYAAVYKNNELLCLASMTGTIDKNEFSIEGISCIKDREVPDPELIFSSAISYAKDAGFRFFYLNLCPLSGIHSRKFRKIMQKSQIIFPHQDFFENQQNLRKFKELFSHLWFSRYIAVSGSHLFSSALINTGEIQKTMNIS